MSLVPVVLYIFFVRSLSIIPYSSIDLCKDIFTIYVLLSMFRSIYHPCDFHSHSFSIISPSYTLREHLFSTIYLSKVMCLWYNVWFAIGSIRLCDIYTETILKLGIAPLLYVIKVHFTNSVIYSPICLYMSSTLYILKVPVPPHCLSPTSSHALCPITIWRVLWLSKSYLW